MKKTIVIIAILTMAISACHEISTVPSPAVPIAITNPSGGATLTDPVLITAATGGGQSFTHVDFYIDSALVAVDSSAPYQYLWNIFNYRANATHVIAAIGYTADSSFSSATVSVTIQYALGFSLAADYRPNAQHAVGVTTYQNLLFVSQSDQGLEVIDISNVTSPQFLSRFITQGQATRSAAVSPYVFIGNGGQGIVKANFSDPESLFETTRFMDQGFVKDVELIGNNLLMTEDGSVVILSRNNPDSLMELSRLTIPALFYDAAVEGNLAFLAGDNALYIVDCSNPANISLLGSSNNLGLSLGVAVADTFAFVANGDQGIASFSISDPSTPRFLARFDPAPYITTVATGDNTLFAAAREGDVYAFNYSIPDTIIQIDHFTSGNLTSEIYYKSPYLFVAANVSAEILRFIP